MFVDPASVVELPLVHSTELVLETLETWAADTRPSPTGDARGFAGVILVDRRGWILLQERDEHPRIDPDSWGLSGGHLEPVTSNLESGALRELEEETGVRLDARGAARGRRLRQRPPGFARHLGPDVGLRGRSRPHRR